MVILGIDPGLAHTGFGAVKFSGKKRSLLACGYIKTSPGETVARRLFQIHSDMGKLVKKVKPDFVAIENIFSLVRYPKAGILLGGVLGVIYITVQQSNIAVVEMTPKEIKNSLVGYGSARKMQVKQAVQSLLGVDDIRSFHAADALAVALAAFYRNTTGGKG
ncbi:MAG TPA: crossover junction endodeoxyribonuclease RuvC [Syntrophorhabdaceae bacterium]|nr:crossover junction endodeoxyribonuclease RuvC [Syntrophorhabdaceae bacterium]HQM82900.1 crossover junction endodeoxyribonuclease RuvC [Syntrophorhabdaceae bacterium]